MTSTYRIIRYDPSFKAAVLQLQANLWRADLETRRAYFDWKYGDSPYAADSIIYLALCGDRVVGMRGFIETEWEIGAASRRHRIACAADTVVAPERRRHGVFGQIMKFAERDLYARGRKLVLNLSSGPITFPHSLRSGWRIFAECQYVERHYKGAEPDKIAFGKLGDDPDRTLGADGTLTAAKAPAAAEMAALVDRLGHDGRIRRVRDQAYFGWRFKNPLNQYRFLYWRDQELRGYLILRARPVQTDALYIIDWEAENEDVADGLLTAVIDACGGTRLVAWTGSIAPVRAKSLGATGFTPGRGKKGYPGYRQTALIKSIDREAPSEPWRLDGYDLLDDANWDIRMLYSDAV